MAPAVHPVSRASRSLRATTTASVGVLQSEPSAHFREGAGIIILDVVFCRRFCSTDSEVAMTVITTGARVTAAAALALGFSLAGLPAGTAGADKLRQI